MSGRKNGGGGAAGQAEGRGLPRKVVELGGKGEREMRRKQGAEKGALTWAWALQESLGISPSKTSHLFSACRG